MILYILIPNYLPQINISFLSYYIFIIVHAAPSPNCWKYLLTHHSHQLCQLKKVSVLFIISKMYTLQHFHIFQIHPSIHPASRCLFSPTPQHHTHTHTHPRASNSRKYWDLLCIYLGSVLFPLDSFHSCNCSYTAHYLRLKLSPNLTKLVVFFLLCDK